MTISIQDLLLVGVPKDMISYTTKTYAMHSGKMSLIYSVPNGKEDIEIPLPSGLLEPVGLYPGLTEEQARMTGVEQFQITRMGWYGWKNYVKSTDKNTDYTCVTALESFASLMEANRVYLKNPFGEKEPVYRYEWYSWHDVIYKDGVRHCNGKEVYKQEHESWLTAQSSTSEQWVVIKNLAA